MEICTYTHIWYFFQSDDEDMEPTKEMTPSEREESEQDSYSMNFDPSQYCFEGEEFPALKIIKVETLDSDEVSQNIPYLSFLFDTLIIPI